MSAASTKFAVMPEDGDTAEVFPLLGDALNFCDELKNPAMRVFRMVELHEGALWDWGTRMSGSDDQPLVYTHEVAARTCCPDGFEVVKRRIGTSVWLPGDAA